MTANLSFITETVLLQILKLNFIENKAVLLSKTAFNLKPLIYST